MDEVSRAQLITFASACYEECERYKVRTPLIFIALAGARVDFDKTSAMRLHVNLRS